MAVRGFGLFVAFGLSLGSLVGILLVLFGGMDKGSTVFDNLFAFQLDLTTFFANEPDGSTRGMIPAITNMTAGNIPGMTSENQAFAEALWQARRVGYLKQFYSVYLWDWCSSGASVVNDTAFCSQHVSNFQFNPFTAMNLTKFIGTQTEDSVYPATLATGMHAYQKASTWLRVSFIIAGFAKGIELILGLIAVSSQWGSLFATLSALGASIILLIITISQTAIWAIVVAAWNDSTGSIGVNAHLGKGFLVTAWLSVVLSFGGAFWWLLTACCANHRSGPGRPGRTRTWIPNTAAIRGHRYENVQAGNNEAGPGAAIPMSERSTAAGESLLRGERHNRSVSDTGYEPYRDVEVGA